MPCPGLVASRKAGSWRELAEGNAPFALMDQLPLSTVASPENPETPPPGEPLSVRVGNTGHLVWFKEASYDPMSVDI